MRSPTVAAALQWFRNRPFVVDLALASVFAAVAVIISASIDNATLVTDELNKPDTPLEYLILVGPALAVPFRRLAPATAAIAGGLLQAVVWSQTYPDTYTATAVLIYSAAAYGGRRGLRSAWGVGAALTLYTGLGVLVGEAPAYALPVVGFFGAAAAALGTTTAGRQASAEEAVARAVEGERSREVERERALADERARIARELHDVVAHGLSVIVVQASAAQRIIDRDTEGASHALHQIEQTGRTALNEMRQVLSAIRTEPAESWQPTPGLDALDGLVAELSATGLRVAVTSSSDDRSKSHPGDPSDHAAGEPLDPLPATVDLTAYRIVQESLTNVLKHGGRGATATVDISRTPRSLDLRIVDNGRGAAAADAGGHGLRGMQERVEVFGGRFDAGPRPGGGFAVSVSLPIDGP